MSDVSDLENAIRDIFNIPRRHKESRKDRGLFNQACAALDAIGDTEFALNSYESISYPDQTGGKYIIAYGILQALFIQQDAISHLAKALGMPCKLPDELRTIRELRNDAIGHPTQREIHRDKRIYSFHHISRVTLSKRGFQMMSTYSNSHEYRFTSIDISQIISVQHTFASKLLNEVYTNVKKRENSHRQKYRNVKLAEIFHPSVPYLFSKVLEGVTNPALLPFGQVTFDGLVEIFNKFETLLTQRGDEEALESLKFKLQYPVSKVKAYFTGVEKVDPEAVRIFIQEIQRKFDEAQHLAIEIDKDYETDV